MIYPFDVQSGVDPKIGYAIAQILAQEMTAAGGISVLPVPQNVKRPDFLKYSRQQHADVYISGYVTPVGDSAAVVEQVVSTDSGVILFSQTAQVNSVADVASQSLANRQQILSLFDRGAESVGPAPSNAPAPTSTNGAQMQLKGISGIVSSVFHHKGAPAPSPTPIVKPTRGIIVAPIAASSPFSTNELTDASHELFFAMQHYFTTSYTTVPDVAKSANRICGNNRDNTIASGTLTKNQPKRGRTEMVFTLQVFTCFGAVLESETGKGPSIKNAIDDAVAAYVKAHPEND